jgi:hypothetical protein
VDPPSTCEAQEVDEEHKYAKMMIPQAKRASNEDDEE